MTIKVGDRIPSMTLVKATAEGPQPVQTDDYFAGRKIALFSVPGAFTPTCSARHLPGFVERAEELQARGVDEIACTAVNDAFVLAAWAKSAWVGGWSGAGCALGAGEIRKFLLGVSFHKQRNEVTNRRLIEPLQDRAHGVLQRSLGAPAGTARAGDQPPARSSDPLRL